MFVGYRNKRVEIAIRKDKICQQQTVKPVPYTRIEIVSVGVGNLQRQKEEIEQEFCNMRKSINDRLDKLQKTAIDELTDEYNTERQKIETVLKECNTYYRRVKGFQENMNELTLHATQLQTFLHTQTIQKEIERQIEFLESLQKTKQIGIINLTFFISPFISSLTEHLDSFGTVLVNAGCQTIFFKSGDQTEAQLFHRTIDDEDNLFIERKSSITCCFTESCALLPNAKIVHIAQGRKSLHVSDFNGSNRREIKLPEEAWGVVHINDSVVAVTFFERKMVAFIEMGKGNIIKKFKVKDHCHGSDEGSINWALFTPYGDVDEVTTRKRTITERIDLTFDISQFITFPTEHLNSFGTVSVNTELQTMFSKSGDQINAQLFHRSVNEVEKLFIEENSSFMCCFTESCALLPNAQIVHIAEGHKSLHITAVDGSNRREIELFDETWGVVHMHESVIAVIFFKLFIDSLKNIHYCDLNGSVIWTYQQDTCHDLAAITVDEHGVIYAACLCCNYIVGVKGNNCKELISDDRWCDYQGEYTNVDFDICNSTKKLLTYNICPNSTCISVFDIKYG
ncbi:unnamed protein product [Mytilus edulis]|uniref:Uncharacterized protein n=1 Tax=Mytilus edulis TaxID=6550 RepID=A0A8S3UZJ6_MYTED|nr:unnamed protein product [Mytilus edulis]